jgi:archaellum biogenesis ATPase FlaH
MINPVLDYVDEKGWQYRLSGDELIIKDCPYCGKRDWKFYINQKTRLFLCFHASCATKGHISKLKKHVGDVVEIESIPKAPRETDFTQLVDNCHMMLLENETTIRYLDDCGITLEAINRFKLGIRKVNKNMWLVYPSMIEGVPEYVKYRLLPFNRELTAGEKETGLTKFKREKGATSILFNQDALALYDDIIVTEGERDAITLLMAGYENVVGTTGGAQTLLPQWYDVLKEKEKISLVFDADEAGQKGAKDSWASRLGYGKCHNIVLPDGMDITEYFMEGHTVEEFNALLGASHVFNIPGVKSIISVLRDMSNNPIEAPYYPTPWSGVNRLLGGGFRNGEMVTLSAPPGVGKTTLALQISSLYAYKLAKPTLFFCMEMSFDQLVRLFVSQSLDRPWSQFRREDALLFSMQFEDVPIYFGYAPRIKPLQIQQTFLEARDRFGIEFFVFDNLHTLIREHDHVTERIGAASKMFKDLAMETNTIVMLIAQPRKMEKDAVMHYYEIKGSSDIPADSDIVCLLHRNRTKEEKKIEGDIEDYNVNWNSTRVATFENRTRFIVDKVRESAGGECRLKFDGTYRQFYSEDD